MQPEVDFLSFELWTDAPGFCQTQKLQQSRGAHRILMRVLRVPSACSLSLFTIWKCMVGLDSVNILCRHAISYSWYQFLCFSCRVSCSQKRSGSRRYSTDSGARFRTKRNHTRLQLRWRNKLLELHYSCLLWSYTFSRGQKKLEELEVKLTGKEEVLVELFACLSLMIFLLIFPACLPPNWLRKDSCEKRENKRYIQRLSLELLLPQQNNFKSFQFGLLEGTTLSEQSRALFDMGRTTGILVHSDWGKFSFPCPFKKYSIDQLYGLSKN